MPILGQGLSFICTCGSRYLCGHYKCITGPKLAATCALYCGQDWILATAEANTFIPLLLRHLLYSEEELHKHLTY